MRGIRAHERAWEAPESLHLLSCFYCSPLVWSSFSCSLVDPWLWDNRKQPEGSILASIHFHQDGPSTGLMKGSKVAQEWTRSSTFEEASWLLRLSRNKSKFRHLGGSWKLVTKAHWTIGNNHHSLRYISQMPYGWLVFVYMHIDD